MQIHELNNYDGNRDVDAYVAVDNGQDTGKLSIPALLQTATEAIEALDARIDNIITSPAPSEQEIIDARQGADGIDYTSLGKAIRGQISNLMNDIETPNVWAEHELTYHIKTGTASHNGITASFSPNGISVSGTPSALSQIEITDPFYLPAGDYYISDGYEAHAYTEPSIVIAAAVPGTLNNLSVIASDNHYFSLSDGGLVYIAVRTPVNAGQVNNFALTPSLYHYDGVKGNSSLTNQLFERSDNLADKAKFTRNYYVSNTGQISRSTTYFYTEKIPVVAGSQISFSSSRFIAYYNDDTFVSGLNSPASPQTVPNGVNYAILTGYMANISSYMVNTGSTLKPYAEYIVPKSLGGGGTATAKNIIVFGDSWTDIVNTTWTRWPVLINQLDEYSVTSYGVTGSTIKSHITTQINNFLADSVSDVDTFILMGGVNDYRGGIAYGDIITAVEGYYSTLIAAYPNARFIYLANNQLYYSAEQLKYFNTIVEQLNVDGVESYAMFAWAAPSQYANDFIHLGNPGNVCLANNILKLLRGGEIKTVVNKFHWDIYDDNSSRIGQLNIFEFYENGYPRIEIKGVANGPLANKTTVKTVNTKSMFTSAPWAMFPYAISDYNKHVHIYSPYNETLDANHQVMSFDITLVTTNAGFIFTSSGNGLTYEA